MDPGMMMMLASLASGVLGGLTGQKEQKGSTYNPQQLSSIDDILSSIRGMKNGAQDITQNPNYQEGQNWLSSLFNDEDFLNRFEAPLQRQFQEQTIPDLANRFASMGSGGSLGSTGFRNQLAREGSNLGTNIAALRGQMQQQGVNQGLGYAQQPFSNLMNLYSQALQPTQNTYQGASSGFFGPISGALAGGASQFWGNQMGQQGGLNSIRQPGQSPSTF